MGQAKKRGTLDHRIALAVQRNENLAARIRAEGDKAGPGFSRALRTGRLQQLTTQFIMAGVWKRGQQ